MTTGSTTPLSSIPVLQANTQRSTNKKVLLVVDDDSTILTALSRLLGRNFDVVLTAESSSKALTLLNTFNVTHLICDYWLGTDEPQGLDLISIWRKRYPSIRRAVLFTGTDLCDITMPLSVDRILSKSELPSLLIDAITD